MDDYNEKKHTIGIRKSATYPHLITIYRSDWSNQDAWNQLVADLDLPPDTPKVGLLISRKGIKT